MEGHDYLGHAVVRLDSGADQKVTFDRLRLLENGPAALDARDLFLAGIDRSRHITKAHPRIVAAMERRLDKEVWAGHSVREYLQAFYEIDPQAEVLGVGGSIRDMEHLLAVNPEATDDQLDACAADMDLVVNLIPEQIRQAVMRVAPETKDDNPPFGIWSSDKAAAYGTVAIGSRKQGLDVTSLVRAKGERGNPSVLGKRLLDDAKLRDFHMSALYYDFRTREIIDPTGQGLEAARAGQLTPLSVDNVLRYLKFRDRRWGTSPELVAQVREMMSTSWAKMTARDDARFLVNAFARMVPGVEGSREEISATVQEVMDKLEAGARADGLEGLFVKYVVPQKELIVNELMDRLFRDKRRASTVA
jgi:hypothetical protein